MAWLLVLTAPLALAFLVWAHVAFWSWKLAPRGLPDEVHFARTADGWHLALRRYRPRGDGPRFEEPVVLCHGLGVNHYNFDWDPPYGVAQYLASRGRDAWVVSLRGHRDSDRPTRANGLHWGFSFDDHARLDVPAVIEHVRSVTGAARLQWVGHSMGGLLAYAQGGTVWGDALGAVVALGSPSSYADQPYLQRLTRLGAWAAGRTRLRQRWLTRLVAPFTGWFDPPFSELVIAPQHIPGAVVRRLQAHAFEDMSAGVTRQFYDWVHGDHFRSLDGTVDYQRSMAALAAPVLVVGGDRDFMAPPACMDRTMERLGPGDRTLVIVGKDRGQGQAYGHGDLIFGRRAPEQIYPLVADWLEVRATRTRPSPP